MVGTSNQSVPEMAIDSLKLHHLLTANGIGQDLIAQDTSCPHQIYVGFMYNYIYLYINNIYIYIYTYRYLYTYISVNK